MSSKKTKKFRQNMTGARIETWGVWQDRSEMVRLYSKIPGMYAAFMNQVISVQLSMDVTEWGEIRHLWIKRHDEKPVQWQEMQRIKNELIGQDRVGLEVYPAVSELIDVANMYHMWILPAAMKLPFTLNRITYGRKRIAADEALDAINSNEIAKESQ